VELPARFDLREVRGVLDDLRAADGPVTFDAARVEVMTSPALQVLLAAARDPSCDMRIRAPSASFLDCLDLLGVAPAELCCVLEDTA